MVEFYDIFSKRESSKKKVSFSSSIIVDSREKNSLVPSFLSKSGLPYSFERLEVGDYLIEGTVFERKSFSDFVSSLLSKRLYEQLVSLSSYNQRFLIVEGFNSYPLRAKIHDNALRGMLFSVIADFGVPIIFSRDEEDTAKFLAVYLKRMSKDKGFVSLRASRKVKSVFDQQVFVLEGFPGVGPVLARRLLERFGSLKKVFSSSKDELLEVDGFDESKVDVFLSLLSV